MESKNIKILWNFNAYTDRKIEARRSDVIVTDKRDKKAKLINLSVTTDHGLMKRKWRRLTVPRSQDSNQDFETCRP